MNTSCAVWLAQEAAKKQGPWKWMSAFQTRLRPLCARFGRSPLYLWTTAM